MGPPPIDPAAVGRLANRVEILNVELVYAHFERADDGPVADASTSDTKPDIAIDVDWDSGDASDRLLGCLLRFATIWEEADNVEPYRLLAEFRLTYSVQGEESLDEADVKQFVHWNALFNAWPYWREYLSSTLNRAGLPRFQIPVLGVPRKAVE